MHDVSRNFKFEAILFLASKFTVHDNLPGNAPLVLLRFDSWSTTSMRKDRSVVREKKPNGCNGRHTGSHDAYVKRGNRYIGSWSILDLQGLHIKACGCMVHSFAFSKAHAIKAFTWLKCNPSFFFLSLHC